MVAKWSLIKADEQELLAKIATNIAVSYGLDPATAEDLCQQAQLQVARRAGRFEPTRVLAYTKRTMQRLACSELRGRRRASLGIVASNARARTTADVRFVEHEVDEWLEFLEALYGKCGNNGRLALDMLTGMTTEAEYRARHKVCERTFERRFARGIKSLRMTADRLFGESPNLTESESFLEAARRYIAGRKGANTTDTEVDN